MTFDASIYRYQPTGLTLDELAIAETVWYGISSCWWTTNVDHLNRHPNTMCPCDPTGGHLMMTNDVKGFIDAAKENPTHYGKHGLETMLAAYHGHITLAGLPTAFRGWDLYEKIIDQHEAQARHLAQMIDVFQDREVDPDVARKVREIIQTYEKGLASPKAKERQAKRVRRAVNRGLPDDDRLY